MKGLWKTLFGNSGGLEGEVDTVERAESLARSYLKGSETRLQHTYGVVRETKRILRRIRLRGKLYQKCVQASYLHDIGESEELNKVNFRALDGYNYLVKKGWGEDVCYAVMHQSFAEDYIKEYRRDLIGDYDKVSKTSERSNYVKKVITVACMHTSEEGERISYTERVKEVGLKYGKDSNQYRHIVSVGDKLEEYKRDVKYKE